MKNYHFTLVLEGADENTIGLEDAIFEAGCDDALINFRDGTVYLDFNRIDVSLMKATISAIHQIETISMNIKVVSVEPEYLVAISDIARRLHLTKQNISLYVKGKRRKHSPFPHPVMKLSDVSPLWNWREVVSWSLENHLIDNSELLEQAIFLENLNLMLAQRRAPDAQMRKKLEKSLKITH